MSAAILALALAATAAAQVAYKAFFLRRRRILFIVAMGLFAVAQICFFLALRELPVGVVYMSTGLTQALVLALSHYVLKEQITQTHIYGVGVIAAGLVLYAA